MKSKRQAVCVFAVIAALSLTACKSNASSDEENVEYTVTGISAAIDENWESLGYAARPTKYIAISFDDGPAGAVTNSLLATLEAKKVKATFFLIGQNIHSRQAPAKAIFAAGHELGNHSNGYDGLGGSTAEDTIRTSLEKASAEIKEITGADPVFFRAPNVAYGTNLTKVCTEMGMSIIGVSVWSNDYQGAVTTEQLVQNVLTAAQDGGIINCHELQKTADGLAALIDGLREKGFWIMSVGQLAVIKCKTLEAGKQYDSIK
ncbi:MAG: polysaccharide deacetylase family protein [Treponema sp.]|jgi:peptidoglycan/xylan/chitin deacetylase (PgdA/CDA1 family)|nr:polysaccharide deacetylase family protein [Treponema sp.]